MKAVQLLLSMITTSLATTGTLPAVHRVANWQRQPHRGRRSHLQGTLHPFNPDSLLLQLQATATAAAAGATLLDNESTEILQQMLKDIEDMMYPALDEELNDTQMMLDEQHAQFGLCNDLLVGAEQAQHALNVTQKQHAEMHRECRLNESDYAAGTANTYSAFEEWLEDLSAPNSDLIEPTCVIPNEVATPAPTALPTPLPTTAPAPPAPAPAPPAPVVPAGPMFVSLADLQRKSVAAVQRHNASLSMLQASRGHTWTSPREKRRLGAHARALAGLRAQLEVSKRKGRIHHIRKRAPHTRAGLVQMSTGDNEVDEYTQYLLDSTEIEDILNDLIAWGTTKESELTVYEAECELREDTEPQIAAECGGYQQNYEQTHCEWRYALDVACSDHDECWQRAVVAYEEAIYAANVTVTRIRHEYEALKHIECYIGVLTTDWPSLTSQTSALEACSAEVVDTSRYALLAHAIPDKTECAPENDNPYAGQDGWVPWAYPDFQDAVDTPTDCDLLLYDIESATPVPTSLPTAMPTASPTAVPTAMEVPNTPAPGALFLGEAQAQVPAGTAAAATAPLAAAQAQAPEPPVSAAATTAPAAAAQAQEPAGSAAATTAPAAPAQAARAPIGLTQVVVGARQGAQAKKETDAAELRKALVEAQAAIARMRAQMHR